MTETGRMKFLLGAVVMLSAGLVVASRWAGGVASSDFSSGRRGRAPGDAARAGAAAPDLSFYRTLGAPQGKVRPGAPAGDPAIAPAPGDAVGATGAFVVQAMVTRNKAQAQRLRDRLASKGMPATVVEDEAGGQPIYRVRVGRWRERSTADALAAKLRDNEKLDPWVLQESSPQ